MGGMEDHHVQDCHLQGVKDGLVMWEPFPWGVACELMKGAGDHQEVFDKFIIEIDKPQKVLQLLLL